MSNEPMRGIWLRYWLPLANLAIDGVLLGMMAWQVHTRMPDRRSSLGVVEVSTPGQYGAICLGTLPAGLVSAPVAPQWLWRSISVRWVCLHEGAALLVWFVVGWVAESPGRRNSVFQYLVLRVVSIPASLSGPSSGCCGLLMFLAWVAAAGWGVMAGFRFAREKWVHGLGH